jgi:N-acyl-D-aspartate/D-glutamate deacylase
VILNLLRLRRSLAILLLGLCLLSLPLAAHAETSYDLVISGGRVIDPESGLDAIRNIAVNHGRVAAISPQFLRGRDVINAAGLVVSPGFIDLHQHSQTDEAYRCKVLDGVTTALEMEQGVPDVDRFYMEREGKALINFGATISHEFLRSLVLAPTPANQQRTPEGARRPLTMSEIEQLRAAIEHGLDRGALGIGILMADTPGATPYELLQMFRSAAKYKGAPIYIHVRNLDESQYWLETDEVISDSLITSAPAQVVHANSSYQEDAPKFFAMLEAARKRGVDITTEAYPYDASMTEIEAAPEGWEKWPDEKFKEMIWAATGERLTRETFTKYRESGGLVIVPHKKLTQEVLRTIIANPMTMIASDGMLKNGVGHPRVAGTYSRVLGHYVREEKALTLMDAIRKMTLMPAQRVESRVPEMKRKGRIAIGADADITIFNPDTVIDQATYQSPTKPSAGISYVLVGGVAVVAGGNLQSNMFPGKGVRGPIH